MIVTNINSKELALYASLHPAFPKAFAEMRRILAEGAEDGRITLDGDKLFINVQSYTSKPESDCGFEAHKKYIDIQLILEGEEIIGYESADRLTLTREYDESADYMLYALGGEYDKIRLTRGDFVILFAGEPHAPAIAADTPAPVRKAVVKVLAN